MGEPRSLAAGFLSSVQRWPERTALEVDGDVWSYRRLFERAAGIARTIDAANSPTVAILATRSATAFSGILASLMSGAAFVPLNPAFPLHRTHQMLQRSGSRTLVVDARCQHQLEGLLEKQTVPLTVVLPDCSDIRSLAARWPKHQFLGSDSTDYRTGFEPSNVEPDAPAYLLFTSGSTGIPKGVVVSHRSACHFIESVTDRYKITAHDRLTQMFDLTFDLSVFDMFVAWGQGACVCCPSTQEKTLPAKFIAKSRITVWFSVPSTGLQMQRLRMLRDGQYPGLRLSLFCGEALTAELAEAWSQAAPNSVVENLYGPTEATIACMAYRWDPSTSPGEVERGIVPIGHPLPGLEVLVVDNSLDEVAPGEAGELLVGGPQLAIGYWDDPDATRRAFVRLANGSRWYRTGDLVRRPPQSRQPITYLGRIDHQIKVQGYRVELGEVEAAVRDTAGVDVAVAVGWPVTSAGAEGVVVFLPGEHQAGHTLLEKLRDRLPRYMVPTDIVAVDELPLNANGKIDRNALRHHLDTHGVKPQQPEEHPQHLSRQ